jgi:hypothetical protein
MATLPKVLINRADYQIGGGVALRLRTQGSRFRRAALAVLAVRNPKAEENMVAELGRSASTVGSLRTLSKVSERTGCRTAASRRDATSLDTLENLFASAPSQHR